MPGAIDQLCPVAAGVGLAGGMVSVSNSLSGRHWELDQVPAVGDLTDIVQLGTGRAAGVPTRFLRDCRRTAARTLIRASVPERVAMLLTGHKTRAILDRYNIINEQELLEAGDQLVASLAQHAPATPRGGRPLSVSNSLSGRHWELDQVPAVGDPTDIVQFGMGHHVSANEGRRRVALQRRVAAYLVVVGLEVAKFSFKITGIPEQHVVEIFSPRRADQALHEWVGPGHLRHGLDCVDLQNPQVRRPPVRLEQRIMIGAEVSRGALPMNGGVEHAAEVGAIDRTAVHADADEATRALVHDHEHPVAPEHDGLASKEIHTPQAVCRVADERQPRGPGSTRDGATVCRQHAVHDVLIDVGPERSRDDARNPWTAEPRIPRLELNDGLYKCLARPLRSGFLRALARREQSAVFATHQRLMKRQERRGAYADGDLSDSSSTEEKCPESEQQPVTRCQAWRSLARTAQDDQLLLEQKDSPRSPLARHRGHTVSRS